MKKALITGILTAVLVISFLTSAAFAFSYNLQKGWSGLQSTSSPEFQICIFSDVHIGAIPQQKDILKKVLNDYKKLAPKYKVISVVGDFTNRGTVEEYDTFLKIFNENRNYGIEKMLVMGNHEFFEGIFNPSPKLTDKVMLDRFVNKSGMHGVYYDKWFDGYHFIALSSEASRITNPKYMDDVIISDAQYKWLERTISIKADSGKPIFVFLHQPIDNTTAGSDKWGGNLKDGRLTEILKKYPQAILFSGHTHYALDNPGFVFQDGFTAVSTGTLYGTLSNEDGVEENLAQGLLVNVFEDKVEIKARDFTNDKWINSFYVDLGTKK